MTLTVTDALLGSGLDHRQGVAIRLDGGSIAAIAPEEVSGPRLLALPAFANAHDHARPLSLTSFGAAFLPLETWLPRSALATPPDAYLAAAAPLARAARSGCAAVMVHYTRPSGRLSPVDEAREVARAARDVGVRMAFAPAIRDRNPLVYGASEPVLAELPPEHRETMARMFERPAPAPADYVALVEEIAAAIEGPTVSVQFGPAGVQWCSEPLLEAIAERSAATGRRVHMHLLETRYQRDWADRTFPRGIVTYLKEIGLLSPRLTLAHAVHSTEAEREMIAEAGATIVTNFSSNLGLRSGIGPIREARRQGCRVCVGMDGLAFDEDDDILREMRLVQSAHGPWGFDDPGDRRRFLAAVIADGRASLGAPGDGALVPGAPADIVLLDLDALDRDAILPVDPLDLLFARGTQRHVRDVVVAGRTIVRDGVVLGLDLDAAEDELRDRYRQALAGEPLLAAWPSFDRAALRWYTERAGCC
ncbi:amidohydrolase family protein [Enterovirga rhinocerotis]|uniref:Cytosine/adenosine deaminase-related metal-dependent hydrolase n=1 Tax=Enterovirga rhinocerotis TaxID=1339210 RepID=A0A4R7BTZ9_9HYPH|nr:amidohydrolase family protein [Enterovirga rhinocerotis]TDR88045.1 cytosine/adenosine deaminase-related metal-dependent hydrolase [Enterovirga rhinocerotis]